MEKTFLQLIDFPGLGHVRNVNDAERHGDKSEFSRAELNVISWSKCCQAPETSRTCMLCQETSDETNWYRGGLRTASKNQRGNVAELAP